MAKHSGRIARLLAVCLFVGQLLTPLAAADAAQDALAQIPCESAILMEQQSGRVLFEKQADLAMPPASITKIMTLLLVFEALEAGQFSLDTTVTCSDYAASMGGSQIWLEPGEKMTVEELIKATAVSSANDTAVALGELVSGSEEAFVARMNERAKELGMTGTTFYNATGLDEEGHVSTARDIAIMSRELLKHPQITEYSTIWMDTLRGGETQLVNTNRLVRYFDGTTGLKTGTTDSAGYCLSASATRDHLPLIAVVLGAKTGDERFGAAKGLLEYGFSHYESAETPPPSPPLEPLPVQGGVSRTVELVSGAPERILVEKGRSGELTEERELKESLPAPFEAGTPVGTVRLLLDGEMVCEYPVLTAQGVERMTPGAALGLFWKELTRMRRDSTE